MRLRQYLEQFDICGGAACPIRNPNTSRVEDYTKEIEVALREELVVSVVCNQHDCFLITSRGKSMINILKGNYEKCQMMRS